LSICFASHAATAGEGLDVFLDWCNKDPMYATNDHNEKTTSTWNSCLRTKNATSRITLGTLLHHYDRYNLTRPFKLDYQTDLNRHLNPETNVVHIDGLVRTKKGNILNVQANRSLIFANDAYLSCAFAYDTFNQRIFYLPSADSSKYVPFSKDDNTPNVRSYISNKYKDLNDLSLNSVLEEIEHRAQINKFSSLIQELDSLPKWDGVKRLDSWLIDYCDVTDNSYSRELSRFVILGAVKRAYEPGCFFPHMLILQGFEQEQGKSYLIEILAGNKDRYLGRLDHDLRTAREEMQGKWFVEVAELDMFSKVRVNALKEFITSTVDTFRRPYAREASDFVRYSLFIGTTNDEDFLRDPTGERRFSPVKTGNINHKQLKIDRDQLFAEAVHYYKNGADTSFHFSNKAKKEAEPVKQAFSSLGLWYNDLVIGLADNGPLNKIYEKHGHFTTQEAYEVCMSHLGARPKRRDAMQIGVSLRYLGYRHISARRDKVILKAWRKLEDVR
jgi:hypothetical protein